MNFIKLLSKNIKKNKKLFIGFCILFILTTLSQTIDKYLISKLIGCLGDTTKNQIISTFFYWITILAIFKILQATIRYYQSPFFIIFREKLKTGITTDLFNEVHKHNIQYFDDEMSGRISTAITKSASLIEIIFMHVVFSFSRPLINFVFALSIIAYNSPKLAITIVILCIPFFFIFRLMGNKISNCWKIRGNHERDYWAKVIDSITNYKVVRYVTSVFREKLYTYTYLKKYFRATYTCETQRAKHQTIYGIAEVSFYLLCYFAILYFTFTDSLSLTNAFFAFQCTDMLRNSLRNFGDFSQSFFQNYGELKSNIELIYKPITIKDLPNAKTLKIKKPSINFKHVNFSYVENKPIFTDLNLSIKPYEKVGIVGLSGAGKSTLISLLMRLYQPQSGKITIGTQDISSITELSLHKNISYVPQDVTLFNRSLKENLKIGNHKATQEEIIKACKLAYIHDTIEKLDNGYDSIVGERGILLSGGERQRIAIARAIIQDSPILILDEATSSLDSEAEYFVQLAIENLMKNKTVIAIAHRLSTLKNMDKIVVLNNGEIETIGTRKELLKDKNNTFYRLYKLQTDGYL